MTYFCGFYQSKRAINILLPKINTIQNIYLPEVHFQEINGIPVYLIPAKKDKLIKIELVFPGGRKYEFKNAQARTTNAILREGCLGLDSNAFSEKVDYYGFYLGVQSNLDYANISLVSLSKYFDKGMDLLMNMLLNPSFEQKEIEKYTSIAAQNLEMQLQKNEFLSYREFTRLLFGDKHIYGYNTTVEAFRDITRDDLISFYNQQYKDQCQAVIISGDIEDTHLKYIESFNTTGKHSFQYKNNLKQQSGKHVFKGSYDYQTSIKIGSKLFNRHHEDFIDIFIVDTILGGYFGSRLMKNIRETKGYTYNIYSSLDTLVHDGYFSINCEVNPKHVGATINEIEYEINKLHTHEIPNGELKMVRNYMLGQLLHTLDGPINSSKLVKSLVCDGLGMDFIEKLIYRIQTISATDIKNSSRKYLNMNDFVVAIVGSES